MNGIVSGQHGVALYYPHISVDSDAWLKSVLLLWDSVRRIVPAGVVTEDGPEVSRIVNAGLLQNTAPFEYTDRAEKVFFEKLETPGGNGVSLVDALRRGDSAFSNDLFTSAEYVHVEKVSHRVVFRMREEGWAQPAHGGWLHFDHRIGRLYMCCLATAMAESLAAPLVTDRSPYLGWARLFGQNRRPTVDPLTPGLATLNIEWPDISEMAKVPTDRFLRFHESRSAERRAFREALDAIIADVGQVDDRNQLADAMAKHRRDVERRLKDIRHAQQELGINTFVSAMSVSSPTLIAAAAAAPFVGPVAGSVIAGCGLVLSLASWAADLRATRRSLVQTDPLYYALAVRSAF